MYASQFVTLVGFAASLVTATPTSPKQAKSSSLLTNVTIFDPPEDYSIPRTLYARTLIIDEASEDDFTILATWENYLPGNDTFPYYPIYQSTDGGETWSERSRVYDQINDWGLRYQPFLYLLEESFAGFEAGDILIAGNSIPDDLSKTQIDIYASRDSGYTWEFVTTVANGGEAIPDDGLTPIWEPFLMMYEGQLVCYYSDQRDLAYAQKLVHQTTTDLKTWAAVVDDVAYDVYDDRPGMTTVSALPNGSYIMTYEFYGASQAAFAVYYRIADSPLEFNEATGNAIVVGDVVPVSSPYNVWTASGGEHGTIVVSCADETAVFVNRQLGAVDAWEMIATPSGLSYSRNLRVMPNDNIILITGAGPLDGTSNSVQTNSIDLETSVATT